eukprot:933393-Pelagomonas_calceolata.AAC.1
MVPVGMHSANCWVWTSEDNMVNTVHIITKRASSSGGEPVEPDGMLLRVPVRKLTVWVVSFYVGSGDWGSGLYGIDEPLPAIVMVSRGISRAKLVLLVHVYLKCVGQVVEVVGWESVGA